MPRAIIVEIPSYPVDKIRERRKIKGWGEGSFEHVSQISKSLRGGRRRQLKSPSIYPTLQPRILSSRASSSPSNHHRVKYFSTPVRMGFQSLIPHTRRFEKMSKLRGHFSLGQVFKSSYASPGRGQKTGQDTSDTRARAARLSLIKACVQGAP